MGALSLEECGTQIRGLSVSVILSQLQGYHCVSQQSLHIEKPFHFRPDPLLWLRVGGKDSVVSFVTQHSETIFIVNLHLLSACTWDVSLLLFTGMFETFVVCCFGVSGWIACSSAYILNTWMIKFIYMIEKNNKSNEKRNGSYQNHPLP